MRVLQLNYMETSLKNEFFVKFCIMTPSFKQKCPKMAVFHLVCLTDSVSNNANFECANFLRDGYCSGQINLNGEGDEVAKKAEIEKSSHKLEINSI